MGPFATVRNVVEGAGKIRPAGGTYGSRVLNSLRRLMKKETSRPAALR
jgi:hypothetical protein